MNRTIALLLLQTAAFWPVTQWYAKRFAAGNPDDQWCLISAVTAIAFLLWEQKTTVRQFSSSPKWLTPTLLMVFYAVSFHWLPPLLRAVIAVLAIGTTASNGLLRNSLSPAISGLSLLALPVIPLLQFYLGYPLRVVVGAVTAPLLQLAGLAVAREGTCLNWNGQLISIDAPCSGIKMLWAGLFLLFSLSCFYRLSALKIGLASLLALSGIIAGNILRASALFYFEAGIVQLLINAKLAHDCIGIVTFLFTVIGIVASVRWLQQFHFTNSRVLCDSSPLSSSPVS